MVDCAAFADVIVYSNDKIYKYIRTFEYNAPYSIRRRLTIVASILNKLYLMRPSGKSVNLENLLSLHSRFLSVVWKGGTDRILRCWSRRLSL